MKLAIINCAKRKQEYPCGPREMYWKSLLFRSQITFIENRYDDWLVLSSEHGVVTQNQIIEPYDAYLNNNGTCVTEGTKHFSREYRKAWGIKVAEQLQPYLIDNQIDAFVSSAYTNHLPQLPIRFLKVNSGGAGLFRGIQMWKKLAATSFSTDELIEQGELMPAFIREVIVESTWAKEMRAKRWWYHPEFGSHHSESVYEMTTYAKQFDPLIDGATLGMVIKGKARQHKGWTLMRKDPEGHYKEDVTKVVNWIHDEYGEFTGCARDIAKKYHKDESNLKNVAIGKTKSSYGWRLNEEV